MAHPNEPFLYGIPLFIPWQVQLKEQFIGVMFHVLSAVITMTDHACMSSSYLGLNINGHNAKLRPWCVYIPLIIDNKYCSHFAISRYVRMHAFMSVMLDIRMRMHFIIYAFHTMQGKLTLHYS